MVGQWASGNVKGRTPQWTNMWWVLPIFKRRLSSIGKDLQIVPHSRRWSCTRFDSHARVESFTVLISKVQFTFILISKSSIHIVLLASKTGESPCTLSEAKLVPGENANSAHLIENRFHMVWLSFDFKNENKYLKLGLEHRFGVLKSGFWFSAPTGDSCTWDGGIKITKGSV